MHHAQSRRRVGRFLLPLAACALSLLSCGREVTGPDNGVASGRARLAALALDPQMPGLFASLAGASDVVPFTRVRVVLRRQDGSVAADTLVPFPSTVDSVTVNVLVPLPINATEAGIPLALTMAYVNAQGDTVFRAGPDSVRARPVGTPGSTTPVTIPTRYSGPGANAARVSISPDTLEVVAGTSSGFTAQAFDAQNAPLPGTPFLFFTLDSTRALVPNVGQGSVTWLANRGLARIVAALPDGRRADTAFVSVILPASQLVSAATTPLVGTVGQALGTPLVFRTLASDNVPVAGVEVQFAVATGGGSLSVAVDTSDAAGEVSTAWTLGPLAGQQTITATATGLTNSPITLAATAGAGAPVAIALLDGSGQSGPVSTLLPQPIRARVTDAFGNGVPGVSVEWGTFSGAAVPVDSATLTDANGVAQTTVQLGTTTGPAELHAFNAALAGSPVTFAVTVTNGPAAAFRVTTEPVASVQAGEPIAVVVEALDALGNVAADFTGAVTAAVDSGPAGATLGGTTSVAAVAGIATFTDLSLDLEGSYVLRLSSAGLSDTTTATFSVTPAAAASLLLLDGDAQADTVGFGLANPMRVSVTDLFGNPVAGVTVGWTIVAGGGALGADSTVTDAAGIASNTLTLPTTAGAVTLEASVAGLAGSPIGFTATAIPAAASILVVTTAPDTVAAGAVIPPIIAEVRDAFGNVVTWFTEEFTITASDAPGSFALGTTTRAAVGGVVTFDDLVVNELGSWFVDVVGSVLNTSLTFEVIAGAPASFTLVGGDGQVGLATQPLPVPISVRVLDVAGNPVVGDTVVFTVTAGGGTLSSGLAVDSVFTNGAGDAFTTWTLGADTLVTHTAVASFPGFANITFTATAEALVANRTWTGAASTLWDDAANWAENAVPTAADSVLIPTGLARYPVLGSSRTIGRLTIEDGATLDLSSFSLNVGGSLRAPAALAILEGGEASLEMSGTATLRGALPFLNITGDVTLAAASSVAGMVFVDGGNLSVGAHSLTAGAFETQNGGTLTMTDPLGSLVVDGHAAFFGGSTAGLLTAGQLFVRGDFTVANLSVDAFRPAATHTVILDGPAVQTVFFDQPDTTLAASCATSCFGTLSVPKTVGTGGVVFLSSAKALGAMTFAGDSVSAPGQALLSSGTPEFLVNSTVAARIGWQDNYLFSGAFTVDTLVAWGAGSALPISENIPTIVAGTHRIVGAFNAGLVVEGTLDVDGNATLSGTLNTRNAGHLRMTDASDTLIVTGDVTFAGTTTPSNLAAGYLELGGNFTQVGAGLQSFASQSDAHITRFTATSAGIQTDALALNNLGTLRVADGATLTIAGGGLSIFGDVILEGTSAAVAGSGGTVYIEFGGLVDSVGGRWAYANTQFGGVNPELPTSMPGSVAFTNTAALQQNFAVGNNLSIAGADASLDVAGFTLIANVLQTGLNGRLVMDAAEDSVLVGGNAFFLGGQSVLTDGYLEIGGSFTQGNNPLAFQAAAPHETWLVGPGGAPVNFEHPGFGPDSSHFGILYHSKTGGAAVTLQSDTYVNGAFETGGVAGYVVTGTGQLLVSRGAEATDVTFSNVGWEIVDGAAIAPLSNITFTAMDVTATQLRITRSGGVVELQSPVFNTIPDGGLFLVAEDVLADADVLTINVSNPTPTANDNAVSALGGAVINGWAGFDVITWAGLGSDWHTPGNWVQGVVPGPFDSVFVDIEGGSVPEPVISLPVTVRALTKTGGFPIQVNAPLTVTGSISTATDGQGLSCGAGGEVVVAATDNVPLGGAFACLVRVTVNRAVATGVVDIDSLSVENVGQFIVGTGTVNVFGAFRTAAFGTLRMQQAAGLLTVAGPATFAGDETAGLLTNGILRLYGDFRQETNPLAFQASAGHRTELHGPATQTVSFANPGSDAGSSHFGDLYIGEFSASADVIVQSNVHAVGQLNVSASSTPPLLRSLEPVSPLLQAAGVFIAGFDLSNVRLAITDGAAATSIGGLSFLSMATGGPPQLQIARSTGAMSIAGVLFDSTATEDYLFVADPSGVGDGAFTLTASGMSPAFHGGRATTDGVAILNGWTAEPAFIWTSGASTDWNTPANWSDGVVPTSTSNVVIPAGASTVPVIPVGIRIASLDVASPLPISLTAFGALRITNSVSVPIDSLSGIDCSSSSARLVLGEEGVTASFGGRYTCELVVDSGTAVVDARAIVDQMTVEGTGLLDINGGYLRTRFGFSTLNDGRLRMLNAVDSLLIGADASFAGGSTSGLLSAGTIVFGGSVTQSGTPSSFDAGLLLDTYVNVPVGRPDPVLTFSDPDASAFGQLFLQSSVTRLASRVTSRGNTTIATGREVIEQNPSGALDVRGDLIGGADFGELFIPRLFLRGNFAYQGIYGVDTTYFTGSGQFVPALDGNFDPLLFNQVEILGSAIVSYVSGDERLNVGGDLIIRDGGQLTVALPGEEAAIDIAGDLVTEGSGVLVMQQATGEVNVAGTARFGGGSTEGLLTAGLLNLTGPPISGDTTFIQRATISGSSFAASGTHETAFTGGNQSAYFETPGYEPGAAHFGHLRLEHNDGLVELLSDAFAEGQVRTVALSGENVSASLPQALHTRGADLQADISFNNVSWVLGDGAAVSIPSSVWFSGMDPDVIQFAVQRAGGTVTVADLNFFSAPTNGLYLRATDTDPGNADDLVVDITSVSPASSGGSAVADAPASINGWDFTAGDFPLITWTGAVDSNWSTAGNWTLGRVPQAGDSVVINLAGASTVNVNVSTTVAYLDLGGLGTPTLNQTAGTSLTVDSVAILYPGSSYNLTGGSTLTGDGSVLVFGDLTFDGATMSGGGATSIAVGGTASIAETSAVTLVDRTIVVQGVATVGGAGIGSAGSATIGITAGGVLDFQGATNLFANGAEQIAISGGTLRFSPSASDTVRVDWDIAVAGLASTLALEVASGVADLRGIVSLASPSDSAVVRAGATLLSSNQTDVFGPLHVAAGGLARFTGGGAGTHSFESTSSVSGAGSIEVAGAQSVTVSGAFDIGSFTLGNATFDVAGSDTVFVGDGAYTGGGFLNGSGVLAIRGAFASTGGNPNGTGTIAVLPGATLTWNSPLRGWNLDIAGTLVWGDWILSLEQFAAQDPSILIRSSGLLDIQHAASARDMFASSANILTNQGTIRKSSGTATTLIRAQVNHEGFMDALAGTLSFQFACAVNGGTFGSGGGSIVNCGP